jgi:ATP-dependent Clp protease ATP-binding subunit ClpA
VLTEHLLLSLIRHEPFRKTLNKFGCDVAMLETELCGYLDSCVSLVQPNEEATPRKTQGLERVFNRALTQVLFSGRRQIVTIDLYLAIMSETNSHAHYFLLKFGVTKGEFAEFWKRHYKSEKSASGMSDQQATEVLEEYCTSLTTLARTDRLEPLIAVPQN